MKQIVVYWPFKGLLNGKPLFRLAIINFRQNELKEILDSYNTLRNSEFDEDYDVIGQQDIAKDEYQKRLAMPITQKNV